MSKKDSVKMTLMFNCNVNLNCDGEILKCRYIKTNGRDYGTWVVNGEDTGLQVFKFYDMLKEKYEFIRVTWKRQF